MDLRTYLDGRGHGSAKALAESIGVQPVLVSQWAAATRPIPVEHCAAIERATYGAICRWHLRPHDWHHIWPELVGTRGAPPPPAQLSATTIVEGNGA